MEISFSIPAGEFLKKRYEVDKGGLIYVWDWWAINIRRLIIDLEMILLLIRLEVIQRYPKETLRHRFIGEGASQQGLKQLTRLVSHMLRTREQQVLNQQLYDRLILLQKRWNDLGRKHLTWHFRRPAPKQIHIMSSYFAN
jgi:hypothetical protein